MIAEARFWGGGLRVNGKWAVTSLWILLVCWCVLYPGSRNQANKNKINRNADVAQQVMLELPF